MMPVLKYVASSVRPSSLTPPSGLHGLSHSIPQTIATRAHGTIGAPDMATDTLHRVLLWSGFDPTKQLAKSGVLGVVLLGQGSITMSSLGFLAQLDNIAMARSRSSWLGIATLTGSCYGIKVSTGSW